MFSLVVMYVLNKVSISYVKNKEKGMRFYRGRIGVLENFVFD